MSLATASRGARRRLWIKLLLAYLLPVALVTAAVGTLSWRAARLALERQLGQQLVSLARAVAGAVARPGLAVLQPGDEGSRTYRRVMGELDRLQQAFQVAGLLVFDGERRALADSRQRYHIGEEVVELQLHRAELRRVFSGRACASVLFRGSDGRLYKSGFAPVPGAGQVPAAAVMVAASAGFFSQLDSLRHTLTLAGLAALGLVALLTLVVSRAITRPLRRLARAAAAIGAGDLATHIPVETRDEIGLLATTLEQMRGSLQERDRRLQMMLSGIAHEVRNPLGGMSLFLGLLREDLAGDSAAMEKLQRVQAELDDLERVVNDFLDFARHQQLEIEELELADLLEQLPELLEPHLQRAAVRLRLPPGPGLRLRADGKRLRQVLVNLVHNAIQASPRQGEVAIDARADGSGLVLEVSDQGPGIPPQVADRIFEPFFTSRQKGTGLGLALARKTIEAHGGTIEFHCPESGGTVFVIRLPSVPPAGTGEPGKGSNHGGDFGHR